jgi:hypothetical protein
MSMFFYDESAEESSSNFDPVPAGTYIAQVEKAEVLPTKAGGERINIQFRIADGQHSNRVVFSNINTRNSSEAAQRIGQGQLKQFMRATNTLGATNADVFAGKYCKINVKIRKDDNYGDSNEVTAYEAIQNAPAAPAFQKPPVQQPAAAPWARA